MSPQPAPYPADNAKASSSRHTLPVQPRGSRRTHAHRTHAQPPSTLAASDYTRLYDWAGGPKAAVKCFARDVRRMPLLEGVGMALGGLPLFRHVSTPCLQADICGIVVGVTVKDRKVIYEVDDGTAVLRVHVSARGDEADSKPRLAGRQTLKVEQKPTGIPSCYVRPPSPKRRRAQAGSNIAQQSTTYSTAAWSFECTPKHDVGELVQASGRIRIDYEGDRILSPGKLAPLYDPNDESRHFIEAVRLAEHEYSLPLTPQRVQQLAHTVQNALEVDAGDTPWDLNTHDAADVDQDGVGGHAEDRQSRARMRLLSPSGDGVASHRRLISPPNSQHMAPKASKQTLDVLPYDDGPTSDGVFVERARKLEAARRLLSSQSDVDAPELARPSIAQRPSTRERSSRSTIRTGSSSKSIARVLAFLESSDVESIEPPPRDSVRSSRDRQHRRRDASVSYDTSRSRQSSVASFASSPGSTSRRLRKHQKLPDAKVTDSYFRLQVQKHLADRCDRDADGTSRLGAFSVSDLVAQRDLRELAERLVRIKLARRAQEATATATATAGSAAHVSGSTALLSSESVSDKVKRLFQWTVRQMMTDGFIILATEPSVPPDTRSTARAKAGAWQGEVIDLTELPASSGESLSLVAARPSEEMYQLVSSGVLAGPLVAVLRGGSSSGGASCYDTEAVLRRLSRRDDRFSSLTQDPVESALFELQERGVVSRSPSGLWTAGSGV